MKNSFTKIFPVILIPVLLCSCTRYYSVYTQVQPSTKLKSVTLDSLNKQKKYFLIHAGNEVYGIDNVSVDTSGLTISGRLTGIPGGHSLYVKPHKHFIGGAMPIYYKSESGILDEAHLYIKIPLKDSALNIPVASIQKIETIKYNKKDQHCKYYCYSSSRCCGDTFSCGIKQFGPFLKGISCRNPHFAQV